MTATQTQDLEKLRDMIKDIRFTMLTTVNADGPHARPMTTLESDPDGSLWFFAANDSRLATEIAADPLIGLAYADNGSADFVSVTGRARQVDDAAKAKALWNPALKAWFTGGLDDPKLALIEVRIESAGYWDAPDNRFVRLAGIIEGRCDGRGVRLGRGGSRRGRRGRGAPLDQLTRTIPGRPSKPASNERIRSMSRPCITATWTASRAESPASSEGAGGRARRPHVDRVDDVHDREQGVEGGIDLIPALDRRVSMEDLLENFGVRAERLTGGDGFLEGAPGGILVEVRGPDEVHRDVRIDEDHACDRSER